MLCRSIDLLLSFDHADVPKRFTADRDEQISGGGWILINRKLIVSKVRLSLSTERLPSEEERKGDECRWSSLLDHDTEEDSEATAAMSS